MSLKMSILYIDIDRNRMVSIYKHRRNLIIIRIKTGRLAFYNICNYTIRNHTSYTGTASAQADISPYFEKR